MQASFSPILVLVTGASGSGKTTVLNEIKNQLDSDDISINFFDSIGIPPIEDMINKFGSQEKWQENTTKKWIKRLIKIENKKIIFLEGQFNPDFAIQPLKEENFNRYFLFCLNVDRKTRDHRLIVFRNQPDLANENMNNWAEFLLRKTLQCNGIVIQTHKKTPKNIACEILDKIGLKLTN